MAFFFFSFFPFEDVSYPSKLFDIILVAKSCAGVSGIVDYTNYDDMKYAVSRVVAYNTFKLCFSSLRKAYLIFLFPSL